MDELRKIGEKLEQKEMKLKNKDKQFVKKKYWLRGGLIGLIVWVFLVVVCLFIDSVFLRKIFGPLTPFAALFQLLYGCNLPTNNILGIVALIGSYISWYIFVGIILGLVYSYFKKKFVNYKSWFVFFLIIFTLLLLLLQFIIAYYAYQYAFGDCPIY